MKKLITAVISLMVALPIFASSVFADSIAERALKDPRVHPGFGAAKIETIQVLWNDSKEIYKLRFMVELNRPGKIWANWEKEQGKLETILNGVETYKVDDYGYVYLVTLDMKEILRITGSFGTPIQLIIGTESVSGYPTNQRVIQIHRKAEVPKEEWSRYFEATPLEIIVRGYSPAEDEKFSTKPPSK